MLVACRLASLSALGAHYAGVGAFILAGQSVNRAPHGREKSFRRSQRPAPSERRQGRVRAEPREQAIKTIAPRSLATRAAMRTKGEGNSPSECEPFRIAAIRLFAAAVSYRLSAAATSDPSTPTRLMACQI